MNLLRNQLTKPQKYSVIHKLRSAVATKTKPVMLSFAQEGLIAHVAGW
jgi:hypothetical protein